MERKYDSGREEGQGYYGRQDREGTREGLSNGQIKGMGVGQAGQDN